MASASASVPRPAWAPWSLGAFAALVAATNVAGIFWARIIDSSPAALLILSSRNRWLALALGADLDPVAYWVIAPLRLALAYAVCHLIGRAYHATALNWFTRYLGVDPAGLDGFRRGFDKADWIVVPFFAGSNLVAALTGVQRMHPGRLIPLLAFGIVARLALIQWLSNVFADELDQVLDWVRRYSWWLVGASVVGVFVLNARNVRRGGR
ncbi:MAG: hypothetical protein ISP33_04305 [Ilumatobacteraceae bacterium]|nr:hypothetical protein [Ilumatobacteraceae bacterium]